MMLLRIKFEGRKGVGKLRAGGVMRKKSGDGGLNVEDVAKV